MVAVLDRICDTLPTALKLKIRSCDAQVELFHDICTVGIERAHPSCIELSGLPKRTLVPLERPAGFLDISNQFGKSYRMIHTVLIRFSCVCI